MRQIAVIDDQQGNSRADAYRAAFSSSLPSDHPGGVSGNVILPAAPWFSRISCAVLQTADRRNTPAFPDGAAVRLLAAAGQSLNTFKQEAL
jgi:hypothetical protein